MILSHRKYFIICILLILVNAMPTISQPPFYISPGVQILYGKQNWFSIGLKVSVGMIVERCVTNVTIGVLNGNNIERYIGIQCIPIFAYTLKSPILIGGGINLVRRDDCIGLKSSLFTGCFLFGNIDYNFFNKKRENGFEYGATLVLPILLQPLI
jgi:hypothetical protein